MGEYRLDISYNAFCDSGSIDAENSEDGSVCIRQYCGDTLMSYIDLHSGEGLSESAEVIRENIMQIANGRVYDIVLHSNWGWIKYEKGQLKFFMYNPLFTATIIHAVSGDELVNLLKIFADCYIRSLSYEDDESDDDESDED